MLLCASLNNRNSLLSDRSIKVRLTKVIFACPKCDATYVATQRYRFDSGSFDCWDCMTEIFRWSGDYRYSKWDQIGAAQDNHLDARITNGDFLAPPRKPWRPAAPEPGGS